MCFLSLPLNPSKQAVKSEGEDRGAKKHYVSKYDTLRVMLSSAGDGCMRKWRLLSLGDSHMICVERSQDHRRDVNA